MAKGKRPAKAETPQAAGAYQLKITLLGIQPLVWRRLLVAPEATLEDLHETIQWAFGWLDCHLHEFTCGQSRYQPLFDGIEPGVRNEATVRLSTLGLQAGQKLRYTYDFGDDWIHEIVLEKQLDTDPAEGLPWCTGGAGACPPEDCGGPYGYAELLKVLADPKHPEHTEMLDWAGGPIDPNEFSVDEVNAELRGEGLEEDEPDGGHPLNGVDLKALVRLTQMMLERRGGQPKAIERVDAPERILQLRVTLTAEDPPVWRQVLVSSHTSLYGLHEVIQELFEWDDEHMHGFARGTKRSRPDWTELDPEEIDEDEIRLCDLGLRTRMKLWYLYDWGDSWVHQIVVERMTDPDPKVAYPVCIGGERGAPWEGFGGSWGWAGAVAAYEDPEDPDHEEMVEVMGPSFDPAAFDVETANERLAGLR